jgi:hypothetical protein
MKGSADLGRIINQRHWDRVMGMLHEEHGGREDLDHKKEKISSG